MAKRPFAIFYIDAGKGYFYGSNLSSVVQIDLPADTLSYFDITNRDKFFQLIQTFVTTNKIEAVPLLILIAPGASYAKDVVGKTPEDTNTDIEQFLDSVPFEKVLSRLFKIQGGTRVVATNKDLYEVIKHAFEKLHFSTVAVVSLSLLQQMMPEIGKTLNLETIASKYDALKQYSFITLEEINNPHKAVIQEEEKPKTNKLRLYGLIGVFVVLIGVLVIMVLTTLQPAPKPTQLRQQPVILSKPTPLTMPSITVTKASTTSGQVVQGVHTEVTPTPSH